MLGIFQFQQHQVKLLMQQTNVMLTQEQLKEQLHYDPETGVFTKRNTGEVAGTRHPRGYLQAYLGGRAQLLHRLAFLYMEGDWPEKCVDHINGDKLDNRWCNLRPASGQQNQGNLKKRVNATGYQGIHKNGKGWAAGMRVSGKSIHLGTYPSKEEAAEVYNATAKEWYGEFFAIRN